MGVPLLTSMAYHRARSRSQGMPVTALGIESVTIWVATRVLFASATLRMRESRSVVSCPLGWNGPPKVPLGEAAPGPPSGKEGATISVYGFTASVVGGAKVG